MRSKIFTELLEENGLITQRLQGGYKVYRNWVLKSLEVNYNIVILGGPTGCGKTDVLHEMVELGEQIIDLEGLANHKGSVYGGIGKSPQISNEQFENELVQRLHQFDASKPIWIENESRLLGRNKVPDALFEQMRSAPVMQMDLPMKDREQRILDEYAVLPRAELIASTQKLEKRIGNKNMNDAVRHIEEGSFIEWIRIVAKYYDKMYAHGSSTRDQKLVHEIQLTDPDPKACAAKITDYYYEHFK